MIGNKSAFNRDSLFRESIGRIPAGDSATASQMLLMGCVLFLTLAATLSANSIGIVVDSTCEAGTCPPTALAFGSSETLPVDFTITLPDSDTYLIDGSFTGSNNSNGGGFSAGHIFQITYEGNATGGVSEADALTVQADYSFETTLSSATAYRDVIGAFSSTIAATSSAASCLSGGMLGCIGTVDPPGSFNRSTGDFPLEASGDAFSYDPYFTNNFGAGSPVGSYIVWGQTAAITAPTPEPAYLGLLAMGLGGIVIVRSAQRR